jgi:hypothetical protein
MDARLRGISKWVALVSIVVMAAVLASPAGADVTSSFRHLWREHIRPKLAKQGTFNPATNPVDWSRLKNVPIGNAGVINDRANAVDWTQLKNVPAGFADGTDDVGAGGGGGGGQAPPAPPTGIAGLEVVRRRIRRVVCERPRTQAHRLELKDRSNRNLRGPTAP